jgi:hypothetical protein
MPVVKGKCKLCLQEGVDLQESHFLPKGLYRLLRGDPQKGNPNPYLLTKHAAVQSSHQKKTWLLCRECEQRFSKNGEDWILRNASKRDGSFRVGSILAARKPNLESPPNPTKFYHADSIPSINISAITYFAASMFWRASAYLERRRHIPPETWAIRGGVPSSTSWVRRTSQLTQL